MRGPLAQPLEVIINRAGEAMFHASRTRLVWRAGIHIAPQLPSPPPLLAGAL